MGVYEEQMKSRIKQDNSSVQSALQGFSDLIEGKRTTPGADEKTCSALGEILQYFHLRPSFVPESIQTPDEQLEYLLRPNGVMRRTVMLEERWYDEGMLPLLAEKKSGGHVALLPNGKGGYSFLNRDSGRRVRVTAKMAANFSKDAVCFYRPLPLKSLTLRHLVRYLVQCLDRADFVMVVVYTAVAVALGLVTPWLNRIIFSRIIPMGNIGAVFPLAAFLVGVTVSKVLFDLVNNLIIARCKNKISITLDAAAMARILSLPADFFKDYGAGDLAGRVKQLRILCPDLAQVVLSMGLTMVFSLAYVVQIAFFAPILALPALAVLLLMAGLTIAGMAVQTKSSKKQMKVAAKLNALIFSLISGIQKLRLSGAEDRAFAKWGALYRENAEHLYDPPFLAKVSAVLGSAVAMAGTLLLYLVAAAGNVGAADYMAFNAAFGLASGTVLTLSGVVPIIAKIYSAMVLAEPILHATPEAATEKRVIPRVSGGLELSNVTFRYNEQGPNVLNDLTFKIKPGQYVALVGSSGCGKSTLLRLILGFETPQKGAVYCDGNDIAKLDLKSYRRHIGVVLQDGKLFAGDIYSNIVITNPILTIKDAWEAAEIAGIADDIRAMPMGMHTAIGEGSGGISGGQRQRLMIARAIAPKPRLILFDEATSALDNLTQHRVSRAMNQMKCTRLIIAHRLSTIRRCDRILVMEAGKIIEDGNYDTLMEKHGAFASLVERQQLDATIAAPMVGRGYSTDYVESALAAEGRQPAAPAEGMN